MEHPIKKWMIWGVLTHHFSQKHPDFPEVKKGGTYTYTYYKLYGFGLF